MRPGASESKGYCLHERKEIGTNLLDPEIAFWLPGRILLLHKLLSPQQRNGKEQKLNRFLLSQAWWLVTLCKRFLQRICMHAEYSQPVAALWANSGTSANV